MTQYDPLAYEQWNGHYRGEILNIQRLGPCEFYRYNPKIKRVEVFDKYGILRKISTEELGD